MKSVGARGYGLELRERLVQAVARGASPEQAAVQFSVHVKTVQRYLDLARRGQLHVRHKPTGRPSRVLAQHEQQLLTQLDQHADATLQEHADLLEAVTGLKVSSKTVDRVFARHRITHKKNTGRQRTQCSQTPAVPE